MTYAADDHAAIKARLDQIKSERVTTIAGEPAKADVPEPDHTKSYADVLGNLAAGPFYGGYQAPDDYMGYSTADFVVEYTAWRNTRNEAIARLREVDAALPDNCVTWRDMRAAAVLKVD